MIIVSVLNEDKGGVGKTTISQGIAAGLVRMGHAVLAVDLDRQKHLTKWFGVKGKVTIHHLWSEAFNVFFDTEDKESLSAESLAPHLSVPQALVKVEGEGFYMIPGSEMMSGLDLTGSTQHGTEELLSFILRHPALEESFDFCVIDGAPAARYLNESALVASDGVLVPLKMGMLDLEGTKRTIKRVLEVQQRRNPNLQLYGVVANAVRERSALTNLVLDQAGAQSQVAPYLLANYIPASDLYGQLPVIKASPFNAGNNDNARRAANPFIDLLAEIFERNALYAHSEIELMKQRATLISSKRVREVSDVTA